MIRPANARRCWGPSDLTEAKQRGPTGETAPRADLGASRHGAGCPVPGHWALFPALNAARGWQRWCRPVAPASRINDCRLALSPPAVPRSLAMQPEGFPKAHRGRVRVCQERTSPPDTRKPLSPRNKGAFCHRIAEMWQKRLLFPSCFRGVAIRGFAFSQVGKGAVFCALEIARKKLPFCRGALGKNCRFAANPASGDKTSGFSELALRDGEGGERTRPRGCFSRLSRVVGG